MKIKINKKDSKRDSKKDSKKDSKRDSKKDSKKDSKNKKYKKIIIKEGGADNREKSKSPYILKIKSLTENDYIIDLDEDQRMEHTKEFSPLSGSENDYEPDKWNKDPMIRNNHNCYTYSMSKIVKGLRS
jgi:hypothetical protein